MFECGWLRTINNYDYWLLFNKHTNRGSVQRKIMHFSRNFIVLKFCTVFTNRSICNNWMLHNTRKLQLHSTTIENNQMHEYHSKQPSKIPWMHIKVCTALRLTFLFTSMSVRIGFSWIICALSQFQAFQSLAVLDSNWCHSNITLMNN